MALFAARPSRLRELKVEASAESVDGSQSLVSMPLRMPRSLPLM